MNGKKKALVLTHSLDEGVRIMGEGVDLEVLVRVIGWSRAALEVMDKNLGEDFGRPFLLYELEQEELVPDIFVCRAPKQYAEERVRLVYIASEAYRIVRTELLEPQFK